VTLRLATGSDLAALELLYAKQKTRVKLASKRGNAKIRQRVRRPQMWPAAFGLPLDCPRAI
jgi:hypothetical protein